MDSLFRLMTRRPSRWHTHGASTCSSRTLPETPQRQQAFEVVVLSTPRLGCVKARLTCGSTPSGACSAVKSTFSTLFSTGCEAAAAGELLHEARGGSGSGSSKDGDRRARRNSMLRFSPTAVGGASGRIRSGATFNVCERFILRVWVRKVLGGSVSLGWMTRRVAIRPSRGRSVGLVSQQVVLLLLDSAGFSRSCR